MALVIKVTIGSIGIQSNLLRFSEQGDAVMWVLCSGPVVPNLRRCLDP